MDLATHFRTIWSRRWIVLAASLAAGLAVGGWRYTQPTQFEARTELEILPAGQDGGRATGDDAAFIARTYASKADSRPVLAAAAERSSLGLDADTVGDRVSVTVDPNSALIAVAAAGPTAADAATLSDAVADTLVAAVADDVTAQRAARLEPIRAEIASVEATLADLALDDPARQAIVDRHAALVNAALDEDLRPVDQARVVSPADPDTDPVGPRPVRDGVLAFLLAMILSAELMVAAALFSDRFAAGDLRSQVSNATGLPVLATVRRTPPPGRREAVHELRTNLGLMTPAFDSPSTIAILGVDAGVGCTQLAIDLALATSTVDRPVLLVDGDLRLPAIDRRLGVPSHPGLSDVLAGGELTPHVVTGGDGATLHVLPAGGPVVDPGSALSQQLRAHVLVPSLSRFRLTIVDTPPIAVVPDAAAIAAQCDTTLVVMDARTTSRRALVDVMSRLRQVGVIPLGIVINGAPRRPSRRNGRRDRVAPTGPEASPRPGLLPAATPSTPLLDADPAGGSHEPSR